MGSLISYEEDMRREEDNDCAGDCVEPEEPAEPLELSALPDSLVHKIVNKLSYMDYVQLEECSRSLRDTLQRKKFALEARTGFVFVYKKRVIVCPDYNIWDGVYFLRIPWHVVAEGPAKLCIGTTTFTTRVTSQRMMKLAKLFTKDGATCSVLQFKDRITFSPESLSVLVTAVEGKQLICEQFLPKEFFERPEALNKLKFLSLNTTGCTDAEFLTLMVRDMIMTNDFLTDRGLNRFLKQWKRKEREIRWIRIAFGSSIGPRNFDTILEGLDANPIWTPDLHEFSLISKLKIEDYSPMWTGDPRHVYSLWRSGECESNFCLTICNEYFLFYAEEYPNEEHEVTRHLTDDQFYLCMDKCRWCKEKYCEHRRWHSIQRVKQRFPRLIDTVIFGVKTGSWLFLGLRSCQLLTGASFFCRNHNKDGGIQRLRYEYDEGASLLGRVLLFSRTYFLIL